MSGNGRALTLFRRADHLAWKPTQSLFFLRALRALRGESFFVGYSAGRARGLGLIELMVAVALTAALVGTMFGFLHNVLDARRRVLERTDTQRAATVLIDRLEADLQTTLVGDAAFGSGIAGDGTSISLLTRGVGLSIVDRGSDASMLGELQRVEYRFDTQRHQLEARRSAASVSQVKATMAELLGGTIHKVRFRYHDGSKWQDEFNSLAADRLPDAVEVAMWFSPWPDEPASSSMDVAAESESPRPNENSDDEAGGRVVDAQFSQRDLLNEPVPDRIRVIVIPDAAAEDASSSSPAVKSAEGSP